MQQSSDTAISSKEIHIFSGDILKLFSNEERGKKRGKKTKTLTLKFYRFAFYHLKTNILVY